MPTQSETEKRLRALIGLTLSAVHRAADMRTIQFGRLRSMENGSVGEYALHIQCPWRIEHSDTMLTGYTDLWEPIEVNDDFDWEAWDYEQGNLQDSKLDSWFHARIRTIQTVQTDAFGGVVMGFSDGDRLVVFPSGTRGEQWRLFQPRSGERHFIVGDAGIEQGDW